MNDASDTKPDYEFTTNWFEITARGYWDLLVPQLDPTRLLEIGSYEGASTCYLIDRLTQKKSIEMHCIDTWEGGVEHQSERTNMLAIESRFRSNTGLSMAKAPHRVDLHVHKGYSDVELSRLLAGGMQGYFDFIYVDGSHQAPDVLCDAVLAFRLLKNNGVMAFDDYLWQERLPYGVDPLRCPKPAIDAFTNIYCRKLRVLNAPLRQLYVRKVSD